MGSAFLKRKPEKRDTPGPPFVVKKTSQRVSRLIRGRMVFQQMGKKAEGERLEGGYLKNVIAENLSSRTLPGCKKPPDTIKRDAIK